MSYLRDLLEAAKKGMPIPIKVCPICGGTLKAYLWGYPIDEIQEMINRQNLPVELDGCLCFGDDRDAESYCPHCKKDFNKQLQELKLIPCPLEASGMIFQHECRNYSLLENNERYQILQDKEKICNRICPAVGRDVRVTTVKSEIFEGKLLRTFQYTVSTPGNHIILQKERDAFHSDYKDIYIADIKSIEILDK